MPKKKEFFICPVCAGIFDDYDECIPDLVHCLKCDHHYPPSKGNKCNNCGANLKENGIIVVPAKITMAQWKKIYEWDSKNKRARGVEVSYIPRTGTFVGGLMIIGLAVHISEAFNRTNL